MSLTTSDPAESSLIAALILFQKTHTYKVVFKKIINVRGGVLEIWGAV